jgi:PAS domain S-box-containing protein
VKRPRLSIGAKLALATTLVLVAVSTLLFRELTRRERQSLISAKATAASMVADLFAESLSAALDFDDADAITGELHHLEANPEVLCASVFARDGKVAGNLDRDCHGMETSAPGDGGEVTTLDDRVVVTRTVHGRNDVVVGHARVAFSLARENAAYASSRTRIFWLSLLLAIGTAGVLILVARTQIVSPLRRLAEGARRVGLGDFKTAITIKSQDEMADVASAFNRMSAEIGDRESRLKEATQNLRDLFDHMGQAIVAFDRKGNVRGEVSRQATKVFASDALEGKSVQSLLYGEDSVDVEAQAFQEWSGVAFDATTESWSELAELAPREVVIERKDGPIPLELEFRPVEKDGAIDRVMVLATDVSEKKRLEKAIDTAEEEHKRRMAAMRRLVAGGAQLFVTFLEQTEGRLEKSRQQVLDADSVKELAVEVFRHVHTAKGEARAFELRELEAVLEELETTLAEARRGEADGDAIALGLRRALDALGRGREDFVAVSPVGRTALDLTTVRRSDLDAVLALASEGAVRHAVERLASRPFGEATATVAERAPEWAERDRKLVELIVEGREVPIPPALAAVLGGVIAHLVRNAVAHGIESSNVRVENGKEPSGAIWLSATEGEDGPVIVVEDDGGGIDLEAVRARAEALGLDGDPTELVFHSGLSTRATSDGLAGRGVGLDAVRSYLRDAHYRVTVVSEPGRGTKFTMTPA